MERLWSPWRAAYVARADGADAKSECFLCVAAVADIGALIIDRGVATVTMLNRFPYNPGHVLVAPREHLPDLVSAGDDVAAVLMVEARRAIRALQAALRPDGFNVGVNHGDAAGASVEHVHVHVVPRWGGDTNFMPVVGTTKVLPESLEATAAKLRAAYADLA